MIFSRQTPRGTAFDKQERKNFPDYVEQHIHRLLPRQTPQSALPFRRPAHRKTTKRHPRHYRTGRQKVQQIQPRNRFQREVPVPAPQRRNAHRKNQRESSMQPVQSLRDFESDCRHRAVVRHFVGDHLGRPHQFLANLSGHPVHRLPHFPVRLLHPLGARRTAQPLLLDASALPADLHSVAQHSRLERCRTDPRLGAARRIDSDAPGLSRDGHRHRMDGQRKESYGPDFLGLYLHGRRLHLPLSAGLLRL